MSEKNKTEAGLEKTEERYRAFVEQSTEAIWCFELPVAVDINRPSSEQIDVFYQAAYLSECNDVMARMYGFEKAEDLVGTPLAHLLPRSDPKNVAYLEAFIRAGHRLTDTESHELGDDGESKWFLNNLVGIVKDGFLKRAWGTQRDITGLKLIRDISERKRSQHELDNANKRAITEYQRLVERIALLGQTVGQARELTAIFRAVRDFAVVSLPCDGMVISLFDTEKGSRRAVYCWADNFEFDTEDLAELPVREGLTGRAIKSGSIVIDNNYRHTIKTSKSVVTGDCSLRAKPESALSAPMAVMGRTVGCVEIQSYQRGAYSQDHGSVMRMAASLAANAVENVTLMQREREKAEQLRQSQKMEAVGQLAGGVAHDFNNLLTIIGGYTDLTLRRLDDADPLRKNIEEIKSASTRAASLTRQLLAFSRKQMLQAKILDLNFVVEDMEKMLRRLIGEDIDLVTSLSESGCQIKADPGQIEQVILNLAVNARDAMPRGGQLTVETSQVYLDPAYAASHISVKAGHYVMLAVSDTGTGMDADTKQRVFEPFFTTKEQGKGTGLGLSTVYGIVKQTGGYVWVYSELGQGTTFKVYLPVAEELPVELPEIAEARELSRGLETVLLVEDEEMVRNLCSAVLQESGYQVRIATNGEEACRMCTEESGAIDLMITDVVMPRMSGRELAERANALRPEMRVLYMSGYTDDAIVRHGVLDEDMPFLQKPFSPESFSRKVREVLDTAPAERTA